MTAQPTLNRRPARSLWLLGLAVLCLFALTASRAFAADTHAGDADGHTHAAGEDAAHSEAGHEPEILPAPGTVQLLTTLTTLVVFCLLVAVLSKYAWGPIVKGLEARENKIRGDIRDAEAARARADATLKEYQQQLATAEQQVRDLLSKASADAQQLATSIRTNAQAEAEEAKERATREIDTAKQQAIGEIYDQAATLGTIVAEKILRRNLNPDDQRNLVQASLEQMKSVNA